MRYLLFFSLLFAICACTQDADIALNSNSSTGQGGSLARFAVVGDYLYTLELDALQWFEVQTDGSLDAKGSKTLSQGQETIFPLGNLLFLGAASGLSIFEINSTGEPEFRSEVQHVLACDPVVANASYAYVTLRLESCAGFFRPGNTQDVLNIYDVQDIENATPIASYPMNDPRGLGLAGDILFVCEGENGLKILDISDPLNVVTINSITDIHVNDVIVLADKLLAIGPELIIQYDYSDLNNLVVLSSITL